MRDHFRKQQLIYGNRGEFCRNNGCACTSCRNKKMLPDCSLSRCLMRRRRLLSEVAISLANWRALEHGKASTCRRNNCFLIESRTRERDTRGCTSYTYTYVYVHTYIVSFRRIQNETALYVRHPVWRIRKTLPANRATAITARPTRRSEIFTRKWFHYAIEELQDRE